MSKFIGRRFISGTGGDGYSDHGQLSGLLDDDHPQYLITSAVRTVYSPTSGITKTDTGPGDVFAITNAGSGASLFIRQTGTTTDADAALDIDSSGSTGRGLSVVSDTTNPTLPLVQFSALSPTFDEPVALISHASPCGLALEIRGDAYISCQLTVGDGLVLSSLENNPFAIGDPGIYVKGDPGEFYFVDRTGYERTFTIDTGGSGIADSYFPFIEVDELEVTGASPGTLDNALGTDTDGALIRKSYNSFLLGEGDIEIKGLTLRSAIDNVVVPEITFDLYKNATIANDAQENTEVSGGILVASNQSTTETETFDGTRKDGEILFTTGPLDLSNPSLNDGYEDGYYIFVFSGNHTLDTKTIVIERRTIGPVITSITFDYPICSFTGSSQSAVRAGQTFDVTVITSTASSDSQATSVQIDSGDSAQSTVVLTETSPGTWEGTVTARTGQPNGLADINATASDVLSNSTSESTTSLGNPLVLFDNDFPVIESFEENADLVYPVGQSCLKFGEIVDAYMDVSDFTEILYSSPNGRFTIDDPTVYEVQKVVTWDLGSSGIEENADSLNTNNLRIRARKSSNCSETTRNMQVRLDDTPPRITSVRWRRNDSGSYNLTSPVLGPGTHGIQFIFNDPLLELPSFDIIDGYKGTLGAISGSIPGTTFTTTFTVDSGTDTDGCSELILLAARNCSNKQPLDADPIDNTDEEFCIDVNSPNIIRVEIDIDPSDGYWNDGYDGTNLLNDDINNTDNTEQACEVNFSSGVQSITATDIVTRHGEDVTTTVEMTDPIPDPAAFNAETCTFDASPWGASSSVALPKYTNYLFQGTFAPNLGSLRNDDQSRAIGRPSIWHPDGNDATVTDTALNSDSATNTDILSANGIDNIATEIAFTTDGTGTPSFKVSTDSFRAFMPGRKVYIIDDNTSATIRTIQSTAVDGTVTVDGGTLVAYTVAQNARAIPLGMTDAEVQAWNTNNGLVAYVNDGAFTQLCVCDFSNPEAFSQHLENDQLTQNNTGTVDVDLFRAAFWGSKLSVPNTNGGTEQNPTGVANAKYVWRSKRLRLTTNPTGVQGTNIRFMVFGFSAGTQYRNVNITSTGDWDQNSSRFDLGNNDGQIQIKISVDDPYTSIPPYSLAQWYDVTSFVVSPQSGFKFGKTKDLNIVFNSPSTDVIDKDIYVEITLTTNSSGKAPQIDLIAFSFLA